MDWKSMDVNWSAAWAAGQSTSTPISNSAAKERATSPAPTVVTGSGSPRNPFDNLVGMANGRTEFGLPSTGSADGNTGSPQGSNVIKVSKIQGYSFTNNFVNTSPNSMTVVIWNKAFDGPNGVQADLGSCVAPETPALTFDLAPGENQNVAFQDGSRIGWAEATSARTISGAFATTWGEANFAASGSGYDMSAIMNSAGNVYDMVISAEQTSCISDMTQNYWYAAGGDIEDPQPFGASDGSCYVPGSGATLLTKMGGITGFAA